MPGPRDALRYPARRVLLQRTRLAYVHLRNLLTDAKRDRAARLYGYVAVWLERELILLYLEEGEVVNATCSADGLSFKAAPIGEVLGRVPAAAEYGSVCFHEAAEELLDLMFATHTDTPLPWPAGVSAGDLDGLLAWCHAMFFDGALEVQTDGAVHYVIFSRGSAVRGYFADDRPGEVLPHLRAVLAPLANAGAPLLRLWAPADAIPVQAAPALIQAYRELMASLVQRLQEEGTVSAPAIAEGARRSLVGAHPCLERFSLSVPNPRDPVVDALALSRAMGAWSGDLLWASGASSGSTPEELLKELTATRRHMFQSAGFFEALPWKLNW